MALMLLSDWLLHVQVERCQRWHSTVQRPNSLLSNGNFTIHNSLYRNTGVHR